MNQGSGSFHLKTKGSVKNEVVLIEGGCTKALVALTKRVSVPPGSNTMIEFVKAQRDDDLAWDT